jgi:cytidine deaminase
MPKAGRSAGSGRLDDADRELIRAATEVIARVYAKDRHTVGAAVLCGSGRIYTGVNVESCAYGPCAEFVAVGKAVSEGERVFRRIVAVRGPNHGHAVLPPCGNCRQMLSDYAPACWVILPHGKGLAKVRARDLMPVPYGHFD